MALLNSPAALSNFCREPKDVLVSIHNTFKKPLKMHLGNPKKRLNFEPCNLKCLPISLAIKLQEEIHNDL